MVEVDFLPASSESKSGDSILIRTGFFDYKYPVLNEQTVILIDSGYQECAKTITNHLKKTYCTRKIDYVFITHPDEDHLSGLKEILIKNEITIKHVYIHDPWKHVKTVFERSDDGRRTFNSVKCRMEKGFPLLSEVYELLDKKGISYDEIFSDEYVSLDKDYYIDILGPSKSFYEKLIFEYTESLNNASYSQQDVYQTGTSNAFFVKKYFVDNPCTSQKNESSMILLLAKKKNNEPLCLFSGDAGVRAYLGAIHNIRQYHIPINGVPYVQLPHHGSIKNVQEWFFNIFKKSSFVVSASSGEIKKHPSPLLINYICLKLGGSVYQATDSNGLQCSFDGTPNRPGWGTAPPKNYALRVHKLQGDE